MRYLALIVALTVPSVSRAQPTDDGYCDFVEGVADATADQLLYPSVIGEFGYIDQPPYAVVPQASALRLIGGLQYQLVGIYSGRATRDHGRADCRRHKALDQVRGETNARALAAKARVLDEALKQAEGILASESADLEARRTTAIEATATRVRVEELRQLSADTHRQLSALPSATEHPLNTALARYHEADAQMEVDEAKLRRAQGLDVAIRVGVDDYLTPPAPGQPNPGAQYFAVLEVGINFGQFFESKDDARAAAGRKRFLSSGHDPLGVDATVDRLRALAAVERARSEQTAALVTELDHEMQALDRIGGEDSKRYRQSIWFDWIKAKAEHAYVTAHLDAIREVLGAGPPGGDDSP